MRHNKNTTPHKKQTQQPRANKLTLQQNITQQQNITTQRIPSPNKQQNNFIPINLPFPVTISNIQSLPTIIIIIIIMIIISPVYNIALITSKSSQFNSKIQTLYTHIEKYANQVSQADNTTFQNCTNKQQQPHTYTSSHHKTHLDLTNSTVLNTLFTNPCINTYIFLSIQKKSFTTFDLP